MTRAKLFLVLCLLEGETREGYAGNSYLQETDSEEETGKEEVCDECCEEKEFVVREGHGKRRTHTEHSKNRLQENLKIMQVNIKTMEYIT